MIRRDNFKYVFCESDPPQLYDIDADPAELNNQVDQEGYTDIADEFAKEVAGRWNSEAMRETIIATQKQRRAVYNAMVADGGVHWDYNPPRDASQEYVRNHVDWTVAAETSRFPPLPRKRS